MAHGTNVGESTALLAPASRRPKNLRRALVIDDRMPDAARDAGSNAILGHMRALIALGYQVEFVATQQIVDDAAPLPLPHGFDAVHWHQAPAVATVEEVLRRNAGAYELIYLHRLSNASAYAGLARHWCPRAHVVYSVADLHHLRLARQAQVQGLPNLLARARAVKQAELLAMRSVDTVITHSLAEAEYLAREASGTRVHVVGWPIEAGARDVEFARRSGIAFIGSAAHDPNRDAVPWLVHEIMPRVWERDPTIICNIVGADWTAVLPEHLDRRIQFTGKVPDLAAVFDEIRLTVAPLRFGAGIKGKVLESFAAEVPCVMTPVAVEGLPLTPDVRRLIAEKPDQIADLICLLHANAGANAEAAQAGLGMLAKNFTTDGVQRHLSAALARTGVRVERRSANA
jgi:glycosyltransferase involved in cell wall biosynthesis